MKIGQKLTLAFGGIALLFGVAGYISIHASQDALQESIGESSASLAAGILDSIDRTIYNRIEDFQAYATSLKLQKIIKESNVEFEKLSDLSSYIALKDREWTSLPKETVTAFMLELMSNEPAEELKQQLKFYEEKYGYKVLGEVFVTNKYGANIAQTEKTTDYYQADEQWWQMTREKGLYVTDVEYDESSGVYSTNIGIRIDDEDGNFLGVIKAVLNVENVIEILRKAKEASPYKTAQFKLFDRNSKLIFGGTEDYNSLKGIIDEETCSHIRSGRGYLLKRGKNGEGEELFACAFSKGYKDYQALGWILAIEYQTKEVFAPVVKLKNIMLIVPIVIAVALLVGLYVSRNISKPVKKLRDAAIEISKGKLYTAIEVDSENEIGELADSFNKMTKHLKKMVDNLNQEIAERKRAEERLLAVNALQKLLLPPVPTEQKLKFVTDAVVRILDADFARIWVIRPGDRCDAGCTHAEIIEGPHVCKSRDKCLHLMASSGRYTHIDGKVHRRVPFGCYKIGLIAAGEQDKFLTNEAATDPHVHNHDWVKELGLVSFAGYRLTHNDGTPLGVLALFSKHLISPEEDALLEGIAHSTSLVIRTSQTEEELRKNEEFTKRVIESSSDCIKVLDLEGRLLSMSGGGQKLLEIDDITPYLNAPFIDYWKGKERDGCLEAIAKAKQGDTGIFYGYFETAKGKPKWWEVIVTPIKDANGNINRLLAVSRDITERKKSEESIENLNKDLKSTIAQLTRSNRQLREFAHLAAHDLKTPLRGISTLAQWLVNDYKEKFDDEGRQQVNLLIERVERMNELINAILQYSTITRERDKEYPIDLNTLVGRILVEIRPPPSIKITINKNLPTVICKEAHFQQVFYHLLTNAIKFMDKPEGHITIDYTDKNDLWEFSVSDNGPGIEPQHFERIFQFFQTLDDNDQGKGGGIGLTLIRKIVELYNGQIWLTSELGRGSSFFFTLPKVLSVTNNEKLLLTASS